MTTEITKQRPQLVMRRPSLDGLPQVELPSGYTIRTSTDGDDVHWARILRLSFGEAGFDETSFEREMKNHPAYHPDRIFFVCAPDGQPCGTASAYRHDVYGPNSGCLHYVAVCPEQTGRRLGFAVSLAVLHKFRAEGLKRAVLQTDDFRLPAIRTYLKLGFEVLIIDDNQPARWDAIFAKLNLSRPDEYQRHR